jgi:hypothetical protein
MPWLALPCLALLRSIAVPSIDLPMLALHKSSCGCDDQAPGPKELCKGNFN